MTGRPPTAGFLHDQPNPPARSRAQPAHRPHPNAHGLTAASTGTPSDPEEPRPEPPRPNNYHPSQPNLLHRQPESKRVSAELPSVSEGDAQSRPRNQRHAEKPEALSAFHIRHRNIMNVLKLLKYHVRLHI